MIPQVQWKYGFCKLAFAAVLVAVLAGNTAAIASSFSSGVVAPGVAAGLGVLASPPQTCAVAKTNNYQAMTSAMPALGAGQGRIYFFRDFTKTSEDAEIRLNGQVAGISKRCGFFFVDRPAGNYKVAATRPGETNSLFAVASFVLAAGETKYLRISMLDLWINQISINLVETPDKAEATLLHLGYTGDYPLSTSGNAGWLGQQSDAQLNNNFDKQRQELDDLYNADRSNEIRRKQAELAPPPQPVARPSAAADGIDFIRQNAEQGNADAQFHLGVWYAVGQGVPQDYQEAAKWFRRAAEHGWASAQFNLGQMYHNGQGVPRDDNEAAKWYSLAAAQGHAQAAKLYRQVTAQGQAQTQANLGGQPKSEKQPDDGLTQEDKAFDAIFSTSNTEIQRKQ